MRRFVIIMVLAVKPSETKTKTKLVIGPSVDHLESRTRQIDHVTPFVLSNRSRSFTAHGCQIAISISSYQRNNHTHVYKLTR